MNRSGFKNFSTLGEECPRCHEKNDKCGIFQDSNFVMCRTDIGDDTKPLEDGNGWQYWPFSNQTNTLHSQVYQYLIDNISLTDQDSENLIARGLTEKQINEGQYRTIPHRKGARGLNNLIQMLDEAHDLNEVPGFYIKDSKRNINALYEQTVIPVRDYFGNVSQIVLRNNGDKKTGRKSKYIMLGSDGKEEGAKSFPRIHFPLGADKCGDEVRVTEGILKSDVANALDDSVYTIGLPGLTARNLIESLDLLQVSKVRIAVDIDWQDNIHVLNGLRRIYASVLNAGFEVVVEEWDIQDGKGIDDVLLSKGKIWQLEHSELENLLEFPRFDRNDWVYVNRLSRFYMTSVSPIKDMTEEHFNNHFAKYKENFAKEAKTLVKQVDGVTYLPKQERIIYEDNFFKLNLWTDTGVKPSEEEGDISLFLEHLEYLFPGDDDQQQKLLDYLSNIVKHRGKKFSYALLIHGKQGTGKTWVYDCIRFILGQSNVVHVPNKYMKNSFNTLLENRECVVIDEIMAEGRLEFMNTLNELVDQDYILLNTKQTVEYQTVFYTNFLMSTNYDDALFIKNGDRKYLVLSSPAIPGDDEECARRGDMLFRWSGGGKEQFPVNEANLAALHRFLLDRQVKYNPFAKAPQTAAKKQMEENTLTPFEAYIKEGIEEEIFPFDKDIVCIELVKNFPIVSQRFGKVTPHKWGSTLRRFGAIPYGSILDENGNVLEEKKVRVRLKGERTNRCVWILRRTATYCNMDKNQIAIRYSQGEDETPENYGDTEEAM